MGGRAHLRDCAATLIIAAALLALPTAAGAVTPRAGTYSSRAGGVPKPEVAFAVKGGRVVRPSRGPALTVRGLRCGSGKERVAWLRTVTVVHGRLHGRLRSGIFDGSGRWLGGESFEVSGRWTTAGLVVGTMRLRRTLGRRCDSGRVRWRAAPRDPVAVTSEAALTFAIPGALTITGIVTNTGDAVSKRNDLRLGVTGLNTDTPAHQRAQIAAVSPSRGTCGAMVPDEYGIRSEMLCHLGALPAHARATVALTLRWEAPACLDPESGRTSTPPEVIHQVMVDSALNDTGWARDPLEDEVPSSTADCSAVPEAPVPQPVDEPPTE